MRQLSVQEIENVEDIRENKPALYEAMQAIAERQIKKRRVDERNLINENALTQRLVAKMITCATEETLEKLDIVLAAIINLADCEASDTLDEIMKR